MEVDILSDLDSNEWVDDVDRFLVGGIPMGRIPVDCAASCVISCPRGVGFGWKHGGAPVGRLGGGLLIGGRVLAWIVIESSGRC